MVHDDAPADGVVGAGGSAVEETPDADDAADDAASGAVVNGAVVADAVVTDAVVADAVVADAVVADAVVADAVARVSSLTAETPLAQHVAVIDEVAEALASRLQEAE